MPKPPIFGASGDTAVPNTALTRKNVSIASIQMPCMKVTVSASLGAPARVTRTAASGSSPFTSAAPTRAPTSCAPT